MELFKELCGDPRNALLIPGYCVQGTIGSRLLQGAKKIIVDGKTYDVELEVSRMSFSAHADSKGIVSLVQHLKPENVIFVHGEKSRMEFMKPFIESLMGCKVYCPANLTEVCLKVKATT